jgi:signal transduction histidine kinase
MVLNLTRSVELPHPEHAVCSLPSLSLESTLCELPLHDCQVDLICTAQDVAEQFDRDPMLPGVVLRDTTQFVGMISRRRFLERMSRPYALELFSRRSIRTLYRFISHQSLILASQTTIVEGARQALQRSPESLYEPIVVQLHGGEHRLLDLHQLLVAQSRIHELAKQVIHEQTHAQMIQNEKLASLGRLIANVSHEILNPVNFIAGNINYLSNYGQDFLDLIEAYEVDSQHRTTTAEVLKQDIEFEFLKTDFNEIISSIQIGADRLRRVAESLRSFSYKRKDEFKPTDIHLCLDNTLIILSTRLKGTVDVVKSYGDIPLVSVYPSQLSQVFMNLISNAADALADKTKQQASRQRSLHWHPTITIGTSVLRRDELPVTTKLSVERWISISIEDNGCGIPPEIQEKIFDEFFTTKPVESGTGLGLAISQQIVVDKHRGCLHLESTPGERTVFKIFLPIVD